MSEKLALAIDTSFGPVSAALATFDGRIVAHLAADNPAGTQAETLPPLVQQLFQGRSFENLTRVAVTAGPGAFTGVRVGLAFAKGLKIATGAQVLGFNTLDCLAAQALRDAPAAAAGVAIDAKRGEIYVQAFSGAMEPLCDAAVLPVDEGSALLRRLLNSQAVVTGSGAGLLSDVAGARVELSRIDTALLVRRALAAEPAKHPPEPAYLRAPDARLPA